MKLRNGVLSIALLALVAPAFAAPIAPGGTLFLAPPEPNPAGGVIVSPILTLPFATPFYTGTLTSFVISGDVTNPYGGLTFVYQLHNNVGSANSLARLTVNGYAGWLTDASWQPGPGVDPLFIDRQANGDSLGFSFSSALGHSLVLPGGDSTWLVIQTNAPAYRESIANVIDGAVTQVGTWAPTIPTPGSAVLAAAGLLTATRRRRA